MNLLRLLSAVALASASTVCSAAAEQAATGHAGDSLRCLFQVIEGSRSKINEDDYEKLRKLRISIIRTINRTGLLVGLHLDEVKAMFKDDGSEDCYTSQTEPDGSVCAYTIVYDPGFLGHFLLSGLGVLRIYTNADGIVTKTAITGS